MYNILTNKQLEKEYCEKKIISKKNFEKKITKNFSNFKNHQN